MYKNYFAEGRRPKATPETFLFSQVTSGICGTHSRSGFISNKFIKIIDLFHYLSGQT